MNNLSTSLQNYQIQQDLALPVKADVKVDLANKVHSKGKLIEEAFHFSCVASKPFAMFFTTSVPIAATIKGIYHSEWLSNGNLPSIEWTVSRAAGTILGVLTTNLICNALHKRSMTKYYENDISNRGKAVRETVSQGLAESILCHALPAVGTLLLITTPYYLTGNVVTYLTTNSCMYRAEHFAGAFLAGTLAAATGVGIGIIHRKEHLAK